MIVSHLNANSSKGMQWLDDIIIKGLQDGDACARWKIEVHGGDGETESLASHDENEGLVIQTEEEEEVDSDKYGPAVYILQKVPNNETGSGKDEGKQSKVALKFFGY